jgi:hypothetical protein
MAAEPAPRRVYAKPIVLPERLEDLTGPTQRRRTPADFLPRPGRPCRTMAVDVATGRSP